MKRNQNQMKGYGMLIGAMMIFGSVGVVRRYIELPSGLLACSRGLLGALVLFLYRSLLKSGNETAKCDMKGRTRMLLILSGALIGINWILLFEAYRFTAVSVATLGYYMEPVIVILLSPFLLGEKLTVKKGICAGFSVFGMALVSGLIGGEALRTGEYAGILLALGAACMYAGAVILNKRIQKGDTCKKTIIQLLTASLVLIPYVLLKKEWKGIAPDTLSVLLLLITGIVHTGLAYMMYFYGLQYVSAQSAAMLSYIDPIFALILSGVILREKPTASGFLGAVLILGSMFACEWNLKSKGFRIRKKETDK